MRVYSTISRTVVTITLCNPTSSPRPPIPPNYPHTPTSPYTLITIPSTTTYKKSATPNAPSPAAAATVCTGAPPVDELKAASLADVDPEACVPDAEVDAEVPVEVTVAEALAGLDPDCEDTEERMEDAAEET